jgi:hypothetical protein
MNFNYYNLGHLNGGDVVEVTLQGSAANVRLMTPSEYNNYKSGRRHNFFGGLQQRSPAGPAWQRSQLGACHSR